MPVVLRKEESSTLYPVKKMQNRHYDPYHDYFIIKRKRKDTDYKAEIGTILEIDNKGTFIYWLDSGHVQEITRHSTDTCILNQLVDEYDIIEIDSDEYCGGFNGNSVDFKKHRELRKEVLEQLVRIL